VRVTGPERARLSQRAALAGVALASGLLVAKIWAAIATRLRPPCSAALADTALDLVASLVILPASALPRFRPIMDHRFGHGKAEALVALGQVVLIRRQLPSSSAGGPIDPACQRSPTENARIRHRRLALRHGGDPAGCYHISGE
jgi:hypothetical protein